MEGACGMISVIRPGIVRKTLKRTRRGVTVMDATEQSAMQELARQVALSLGLKKVYVPRAWRETDRSYIMEEINVDTPLELPALEHPSANELARWVSALLKHSILALDFEAYEQPDGRVALVDFDKFGKIEGATVILPWGDRRVVAEMTADFPRSWL
jgi:hypothetical protein